MSHMQLVQEKRGAGLTFRIHALTQVTRYTQGSDGSLNETREMEAALPPRPSCTAAAC